MTRRVHRRGAAPAALLLAASLVFAGCATGIGRAVGGVLPRGEPLEVRVQGGARAGSVRGFTQIPRGGAPGSTSLGRPTLEEVGVKTGVEPFGGVRVEWGHHQIHGGYSFLYLHGDGVLKEALTSQADTYPAGTAIDSSTGIARYWLGYRYRFDLARDRRFSLAPGVGAYGVGIRYAIDGSNGQNAFRSFNDVAPAVSLEAEYRPGGRLRFTSELHAAWEDLWNAKAKTNLIDWNVRAHFDVLRRGGFFLETGYLRLDHRDSQIVPNHYKVKMFPWFGAGVEWRF